MTRRALLGSTLAACGAASASAIDEPAPHTTMGVTIDCYQFGRRRQPAYEFAQYCQSLGAAGVQVEMPADLEYARRLRRFLEEHNMFFDVMADLPRDDPSGFERLVAAAKEAGAFGLRVACLGGRRYEEFTSLEQWREFVRQSEARIARALPIVEKHRITLEIENHKDWTAEELEGLMKRYSSQYLAVCLDTGNNLALLDDPMEVVERLAPYTVNTHLKDMGVGEYRDGLLLVEPLLGSGTLDIQRMVSTVRRARPESRFTVEMLTRDPLQVAVLADKYWVTFPERNGLRLARALAAARAHPWEKPLAKIAGMERNARIGLEEDNVKKCLAWAREHLGMRA